MEGFLRSNLVHIKCRETAMGTQARGRSADIRVGIPTEPTFKAAHQDPSE